MRFIILVLISIFLKVLPISAQTSSFKKFKQLSGPEKCWVIWHPFVAKKALKIAEEARNATEEVKQQKLLNGIGNGDQIDAFRHAYWMAMLTLEIGWRKSKKLGKAHEKGNYKEYKKRKLEDGVIPDKISSEMDLYNNDVGIKIGKMTDTLEFKNIVIQAVKDGRCKVIKTDEYGNFIDCAGNIILKEDLKGKWENDKCLVNSDL